MRHQSRSVLSVSRGSRLADVAILLNLLVVGTSVVVLSCAKSDVSKLRPFGAKTAPKGGFWLNVPQ